MNMKEKKKTGFGADASNIGDGVKGGIGFESLDYVEVFYSCLFLLYGAFRIVYGTIWKMIADAVSKR